MHPLGREIWHSPTAFSGLPGSSDGKDTTCNTGTPGWPSVRKIPQRRGRLPTPVFLPAGSQGYTNLRDWQRVGQDWGTNTFTFHLEDYGHWWRWQWINAVLDQMPEKASDKLTAKLRAEWSEGTSTLDAVSWAKIVKTHITQNNKFSGGFPSAKLKTWTTIIVSIVSQCQSVTNQSPMTRGLWITSEEWGHWPRSDVRFGKHVYEPIARNQQQYVVENWHLSIHA